MASPIDDREPVTRWLKRIFSEPTVHFLLIGALLFAVHRALVGDSRTIVVDGGVTADLARRFQDQTGRAPNAAELDRLLRDWKREEVLYREALVNGIDREDPTIRTTLADKMRARAALEIPTRQPSEAELRDWLEKHRLMYETPREYDYEIVTFEKAEPNARERLEQYERKVKGGADARTLGRPILGGNLNVEDLRERLGAGLADQIVSLPFGQWTLLDSGETLTLARLNHVNGGLPNADELNRRLVADWMYAKREEALEHAVQNLVKRYRFEERR